METLLLKPNKNSILLASKLLKSGEVVGVPTETVYGLAGDYSNDEAIKKIYFAKGRPLDNPLIVHVASRKMLKDVVEFVPEDAEKLIKKFWPGPLTLILKKGEKVSNLTSAGLDSVGVRCPDNKIARKIIKLANTPFSAPSANISGKPSPTTANEVYEDMKGKIPLIIDGGRCKKGVESTVLSLLNSPTILRPGVITKEMIEKVIKKKVLISSEVLSPLSSSQKALSPGTKYKHYSPNAEVFLVKGSLKSFVDYVTKNYKEGDFALVFNKEEKKLTIPTLTYGKEKNDSEKAKNLFSKLREFDKLNAKRVFVRSPKESGVGLAVYNRLIRSAGFKIITLD